MARFGPYELTERIGRGGMGEVYRAVLRREGAFAKPLVIKRILPTRSGDPDFQRMFHREARVAALLNHQHIVHIYDFGREGDQLFLAMEWVDGADLRSLLEHLGRPPIPIALAIVSGVIRALDYAHRRRGEDGAPLGIVHRDVSPGNVLLSAEGEVKLTDFGLVVGGLDPNDAEAGTVKGKYAYMSPEQSYGDPVDHRSDLFSWGVLAYELLAGRQPFQGSTEEMLAAIREGRFEPLTDELVPDTIADLIHRCLNVHREDRPESAAAINETIAQISAERGLAVGPSDVADWVRQGLEPTGDRAVTERTEVGDAPLRPVTEPADAASSDDSRTTRRAPAWLVATLVSAAIIVAAALLIPRPRPTPADSIPLRTDPAPALAVVDASPADLDAPLAVAPPEAAPAPARFRIGSQPSGARVLLDGEPVGTSPSDLIIEEAGTHTLTVRLEGYLTHEEDVLARPGLEREWVIALRPSPVLRVLGQPEGATVSLVAADGTSGSCVAPCDLETVPGDVTVRVTHPGYVDVSRVVAVERSDTFRYALEPLRRRLFATWRSDDLELQGGRRRLLDTGVLEQTIDFASPAGDFLGSIRANLRLESRSQRVTVELSLRSQPWSVAELAGQGAQTPTELRVEDLEPGVWPLVLRPRGTGEPVVVDLVLRESLAD